MAETLIPVTAVASSANGGYLDVAGNQISAVPVATGVNGYPINAQGVQLVNSSTWAQNFGIEVAHPIGTDWKGLSSQIVNLGNTAANIMSALKTTSPVVQVSDAVSKGVTGAVTGTPATVTPTNTIMLSSPTGAQGSQALSFSNIGTIGIIAVAVIILMVVLTRK